MQRIIKMSQKRIMDRKKNRTEELPFLVCGEKNHSLANALLIHRASLRESMLELKDNPKVSKSRKRVVSTKVFIIISLPILALMALLGWHVVHATQKVQVGQEVKEKIDTVDTISEVIRALQDERVSSAFGFKKGHSIRYSSELRDAIEQTDRRLQTLAGHWPQATAIHDLVSTVNLKSYFLFSNYLNSHRQENIQENMTIFTDTSFYHELIRYLNYASIGVISTVKGIPSMWTYLVTIEHIIKCQEYTGMTLSLGLEYYLTERLSMEKYRKFLRYDALVVESLHVVISNDADARGIYARMNGSFTRTRQELVMSCKQENVTLGNAYDSATRYYLDMNSFVSMLDEMFDNTMAELDNLVLKNNEEAFIEMVMIILASLALLVAAPVLVLSIQSITRRLFETSQEVMEKSKALAIEKQKAKHLLYEILPPEVACQLLKGLPVHPENYEYATIYFSDVVSFTSLAAMSTPLQVIQLLNTLYVMWDRIIEQYDVYKVETIGDAYMVCSGLPRRNDKRHVTEIADFSLNIIQETKMFTIPHLPQQPLHIRIGVHTGQVAAGVVGKKMPRYCLFGDSVNTASRMESTGTAMKIHISNDARLALEASGQSYIIIPRGIVHVKGKGDMMTHFLEGKATTPVTPTAPSPPS